MSNVLNAKRFEFLLDLRLGNVSLLDFCVSLNAHDCIDFVLLHDLSSLMDVNWGITNHEWATFILFRNVMKRQLDFIGVDSLLEESAISLVNDTINNMNLILQLMMWILLLVKVSIILAWILDEKLSVWLGLMLLFSVSIFLHVRILNFVVFIALKLTLVTSKDIIEVNGASVWRDFLTVFTVNPVGVHVSLLHFVGAETLATHEVILQIILVSAWFEK